MKALSALVRNWPDGMHLSHNIPPTTQVPVILSKGVIPARWGLIPAWAQAFTSKYPTHNARLETAAEKATFKHAWRKSQTCIVPAAGYYEWRTENGIKQPYYIHEPNNILAFAGLWETWRDQCSFTILTEEARGDVSELHHRMPVMLTMDMADNWLKGNIANAPLVSSVHNKLEFCSVSTEVNSPKNQSINLIEASDN